MFRSLPMRLNRGTAEIDYVEGPDWGVAVSKPRGMDAQLSEIGENLRFASRVMSKERWERMCLDTIVHVANATSGFVANDTGMPVCSVGSDAVEVSRIARAVRGSLRDPTASLQIETGRGAYDVVVLPGGWPFRDRKSAVLAWEHPTRCEADVAKLAEEIRAIFP